MKRRSEQTTSTMEQLLNREHTSSSGGGAILSSTINLAPEVAVPYAIHGVERHSFIAYRGLSPEDCEALGGVGIEFTTGASGAEWEELQWHSSRSDWFTEEEMWYRIGCVTREGVLIEGTDPMRGSWLGDMIGMQSSQGCICILSTMMVMYVADPVAKRMRKIPISVGTGGLEHRAQYATSGKGRQDHALLKCKDIEPVVVYDHRNGALLKIWPKDGRVEAIHVQRPNGLKDRNGLPLEKDVICAGTLATAPVAVYFALNGQEIVLVSLMVNALDSTTAVVRIQLGEHSLPGATQVGLVAISPVSPTQLMVQCNDGSAVEMTFENVNVDSSAWSSTTVADFLHRLSQSTVVLRRVQLQRGVARGVAREKIPGATTAAAVPLGSTLQLKLLSSTPLPGHTIPSSFEGGKALNLHVTGGAPSMYGAFTVGADRRSVNNVPIMGYARTSSLKQSVTDQLNGKYEHQEENQKEEQVDTTGVLMAVPHTMVDPNVQSLEQYKKDEATYHAARLNANLPPRKYRPRKKTKAPAGSVAAVAGAPIRKGTVDSDGQLYEVVKVKDWHGRIQEKQVLIAQQNQDVSSISFWHAASKSIVNCIADVSSTWNAPSRDGASTISQAASGLNVAHGIVLLEIVDVLQASIRRIALGQTPGEGAASTSSNGKGGTGGDLTGRNMLVTDAQKLRDAAMNVSKLGMPACVGLCELDTTGQLVCLFADGHVRLLELRTDKLSVEEALYRGLVGGRVGKGELSMDDINLNGEDQGWEGEDEEEYDEEEGEEGEDDDEEGGDDAEESDHEGKGRGRGKGRGKGRGRGRGKGKGKGKGKGRGKGRGGRKSNETEEEKIKRVNAEENAKDVLRKARQLVSSASKKSRAELNMIDTDESVYDELYSTVENEITQLRVVLQAVEAKEKERVWLRGKTSGEMDDTRLGKDVWFVLMVRCLYGMAIICTQPQFGFFWFLFGGVLFVSSFFFGARFNFS